jgi:hypothetical protein
LKCNFVVSSFSATLFQNDGVLGNIVSKVGAKCLKSLNSYMVLMDEIGSKEYVGAQTRGSGNAIGVMSKKCPI